MNQCRHCGANLPDEAKFCMQCGSAVSPPETAAMAPVPELDFIQPALTGGMFLGLLSSLPFINAGNCLCCMWILGGGGLAAFMLMKQRPSGISYGDAAFAGVLSGLFGAIVATLLSIPIRMIAARSFESQQAAMEDAFRQMPELEGPVRDFLLRMASPEISAVTIGFTFFMNLLLFAMFAMIGGILAVAIVERRKV